MDQSALYEILACSATASFHLAAGACLSFSAILIPQLESPDSDIQVNKDDISWIASLITLVMPLGALVAGYLSDRIGRLNTLRLTTVPYSLGWVCIARAQDLHMIMLGRVLTGFSLALASNPALVYITEVARPDFRGSLMCLAPSMTSVAMVLVYTQGAYLHWRTVAWLCLLYCILPIVLMYFWSVESPIWLVSKGKTDRALHSFKFLLRKDKTSLAEQKVLDLVKEQNIRRMTDNQNRSNFGNLIRKFLKPTCWKPMLLLTTLFMFQQVTGIYITIFYAVSFFKEVGGSVNPFISTVGIGMVRLVMGIITMFLMRHCGRRPLFIFSGTGMAIFIFISGYFTKEISEGRMEKSFVPIVCVLLYMSLGVIGFMSIPWTMTAELFPTDIRGMAQGLMIAIANVITFIVLKVYPFLGDMIGGSYAVQWLFCATSISGTIFIFIFLPETHGKELYEIQEYFQNQTIYILNQGKTAKPPVEEVGEEMVKLRENPLGSKN